MTVDRVDVVRTGVELTVVLGAAGVHVMMIRLRCAEMVDEVVSNTGTVARWAVNAWTLHGHDLILEFDRQSAAELGFPRDHHLRLDVDDTTVGQLRTALLEILQTACFAVDPAA